MSQEIDKRVVEMQFDNKQFEKNVQTSLNTIDKLKMALNFDGAKGLDSITQAAKKMDLSNVTQQTQRVQLSFSALQVAGYTMISELTKSFMNFGKNLWNMSFGQMKSGGMGRALKIEQADFKMKALVDKMDRFKDDAAGATQYIKDMGEAIDWAVTGTAYGYDSAASVAAQLMASGHDDVEQMRKDLRAVAGAAAMTGRSYDDMGRIFAAVAGQGRMMGDQLLQFSAGGINAAATIADYLGKTESEVRDMVSKGKIDFQTFADAMYDAYGEAAGKADETYAGVLSNVKAQLSRLGQRFAQPYIRNMIPFLQQVKASIKQISATLAPIAERFDRIFGRLTKYGANILKNINYQKITSVFRGIENLLWGVAIVLHTVRDAFIEVFPKKTADDIVTAAREFERFTEQLLPTKEAIAGLKAIFVTLFAPLRIVLKMFTMLTKYTRPIIVALMRVVYAFTSIFSVLEPIVMEFLQFIDSLGVFEAALNLVVNVVVYAITIFEVLIIVLANVIKRIAESERLKNFGKTLMDIGQAISEYIIKALIFLVELVDAVMDRFNDAANGNGTSFFDRLINNAAQLWELLKQLADAFVLWFDSADSLKGLRTIFDFVSEFIDLIKNFFTGEDITENANNMAEAIRTLGDTFKEMADKFKASWDEIDKGQVIMIAFAAVIIAIMLALKNLIDVSANFVEKMTDIPGILKDIRGAIQNIGNFSGPAQAILAFSVAVAVVTNSLMLLSKIPKDQLMRATIALGSIAGGLLIFTVAMSVISKKISKDEEVVDRAAINLIAITGSILALTISIKMLAELEASAQEIFAAIGAIITLMGALIGAMYLINRFTPKIAGGSIAFITFSASLIILVKAIQMIDSVPMDHMIETMSTMATLIVAFGMAIGLAGKASGWAALAISAFTGSVIVLFGLFMILAFIPMDIIMNAIARATEVFTMFIPLIMTIGVATRIAGTAGSVSFGGTLWALILGLTAFLGMFVIFATATQNMDLTSALSSVSLLVLVVTGFLGAIMGIEAIIAKQAGKDRETFRNAKNSDKTFKALTELLLGLTTVIFAVGVAAKLMQNVDEGKLWILVDIVGILGIALVAITGLTSKNSVPRNGAANIMTIVGLITSMGLIIAALIALQFADEEKLILAATAISICVLAMSMLMAAMSSMPPGNANRYAKSALAMVGLIAALGGLFAAAVFALDQSQDIPIETMWAFGLSMSILLGVIALIVKGFSEIPSANYKNSAIGIAMMSAVLLACAGTLYVLGKVPPINGSMRLKLLVMAGIFVALGAMLIIVTRLNKYGGREAIASAAALAIVASTLVIAAGALVALGLAFKDVPIETTISVIVGLGILFGEMIGMMALMSSMTRYSSFNASSLVIAAAAVAVLAASFIEIASAFAIMKSSGASWQDILAYTVAFGALFAVVNVASIGIGALLTYIPGLVIGIGAAALVFMAFGKSCEMIGTGFLYVASSIKLLGSTTEEEVDKAIDAFLHFMDRIPEITKAIKDRLPEIIDTVSIVMQSIAILIGTFIGNIVAMSILIFATSLAQNIHVILKSISLVLGVIVTWLRDPETLQLITDVFAAIAEAALAGLAGLIEGIAGIKADLNDIKFSGLWTEVQTAKDSFEDWASAINHVSKEIQAYQSMDSLSPDDLKRYQELTKMFEELQQTAVTKGYYMDEMDVVTRAGAPAVASFIENSLLPPGIAAIYDAGAAAGLWTNEFQKGYSDAVDDQIIAREYSKMWSAIYKASDGDKEKFEQLLFSTFNDSDMDYSKIFKNLIQLYSESGEEYKEWVTLYTDLYNDYQNNILHETFGSEMARTSEAIAYTSNNIEGLDHKIDEFGRPQVIRILGGLASGFISIGDSAEEAQLPIAGAAVTTEDLSTSTDKLTESESEHVSLMERANGIYNDSNSVMGQMTDAINGAGGSYDETLRIFRSPIRPKVDAMALHGLNTQLGVVNKGLIKMTEGATQLKEDVAPTTDKIEDQGEASADTADSMDVLSNSTATASGYLNNLWGSLKNTVSGSKAATKAVNLLSGALGNVNVFDTDSWMNNNDLGDLVPKTADELRAEGSKVVGHVGYGPAFRNIQYWETLVDDEGKKLYSSLEDYVNQKSNYGESIYNWFFGGDLDKTAEEAEKKASDYAEKLMGGTDATDAFGDSALDASEKTDTLADSIQSTLDIFTEFNKEVNLTSREVLKNFYSQIDGIKTWQTELEALASRGFNQNFLTELADQGPDAYEKIHALYTMTEQDLTLFNKMYAEKLVMQNTTADEIRKSFVEFGVMLSDDAELIGEDLGAKYDEAVAKAQAEAAKKKNGQMSDATKKRLAQMYDTIEKYQADQDFIKKWYDSNTAIGETAGEAIATGMSDATTEGIIGTAAYIEAGKEMVEMIGKGIDKASPDILKGLENLGYASTETLKNSIEFEKVLTPVNEFRKGVYNQVKSSLKLFDEVKVKTDEELKEEQISTTQMLYNMSENLKRVGKWSYQLRQLAAKGMSEGLVEELRQMGPEAADKVDAFARMSADELKMANRYYEESVQATSSIADRMTSEYAKQGFAVALGLKEGVDEGKEDLLAKMYEIGAESSEGFKKGIDPDAANTAMILLGNNSLLKLMEALDVHSPSRKTYDIGVNTILGLTNGIADPTANAELLATIADLGLKVKQAYDEATDEKYIRRPVSDLDNDIYQPVIRPVVDMSGVEFGIASFFANRQFSLSGTINNAFAAQRTGPSPDAIMITNAIDRLSVEQRAIRNDINNIRSDVSNLGNRIDGMRVVLDGNALVGELVAPLDRAMGNKVIKQKRGRM